MLCETPLFTMTNSIYLIASQILDVKGELEKGIRWGKLNLRKC